MKKCETCETIAFLKEEFTKRKHGGVALNITFKAAVVEEIRKNRTHAGRVTHKARQMKFCPECGRKLRPCETRFRIKPPAAAEGEE